MASNAKTKKRKARKAEKDASWLMKFRRDIDKIRSTGDTPNHYIGGGQAFTKGKSNDGQ